MQANQVRNLLGLIAVSATAAGAYFNHNYYYVEYYRDKNGKKYQAKGQPARSGNEETQ